MATKKKLNSRPITEMGGVRDYSNDPFVLRKNKQAKEFLEKNGFPKELDGNVKSGIN